MIDSNQLSNANQNFIYARDCKSIKAELFGQLENAENIINGQRQILNAKDSVIVALNDKYLVSEKNAAELTKQIKKNKRKSRAGKILLGGVIIVESIFLILLLAK